MNIATCFDSKESSSGYSVNHNIDIASDSAHFGIPKIRYVHNRQQINNCVWLKLYVLNNLV